MAQPESRGREVHRLREAAHRARALVGEQHRHVVGGDHYHRRQRLADRDLLAGLERQLGRRRPGRVTIGHHHRVWRQAGPDQQGGQHLGEARRRLGGGRVPGPEHGAGLGVDQDRKTRGDPGPGDPDLGDGRPGSGHGQRRSGRRSRQHQCDQGERDEQAVRCAHSCAEWGVGGRIEGRGRAVEGGLGVERVAVCILEGGWTSTSEGLWTASRESRGDVGKISGVFHLESQEQVMRVTVIGAGHVGLVTAVCLAKLGHEVVADDDDAAKMDLLRQGTAWFYEPGLDELLREALTAGSLRFTSDKAEAVRHGEVIFICVGTPSRPDGSPNLAFVEAVAREVARHLPVGELKLICEKSTVPVQTGEKVAQVIDREAPDGAVYEVASNPEFLREGSAVTDTLRPDRIVVGTDSERGAAVLRELYAPILQDSDCEWLATDRATAELIKHASNAFLATKISFINAVARVCERSGADVAVVARGMGLNPRIGPSFLRAGPGYGGSCFPKDVAAFAHRSRELGVDFTMLNEVARINIEARRSVVEKVRELLWHLDGKRIGVLGLTFKPETDDLRESPAIDVVRALLDDGASVVVYDPVASDAETRQLLPGFERAAKAIDVADGAHALVLLTEWAEFADLDPVALAERMAYPIVVDARNALDRERYLAAGFTVAGMGRPVAGRDRKGR